jgi:GTP-binding protein HflX
VLAMNKLFATLDTRTRRWQLPNWGPVLISDTVGFIKHLPHRLIASFKSTLAEAVHADLLLHVADASNPAVFDQINAVYQVLEEIGIQAKDTLLVLNKVDAVESPEQLDAIMNRYPSAVPVSARKRTGLEELAVAVSDALSHGFQEVDVETSIDNGRLISWLASAGEVLGRRFSDDRAIIHCRLPQTALGRINRAEATVRAHANGNGQALLEVERDSSPVRE